MRKIRFTLLTALVFLSAASAVNAQSTVSAFAGNWMMDRAKTDTGKDFPQKLKNYRMVVAGSDDAMNVRSQVEGTVIIESAGRGAATPVTESASMNRRDPVSATAPSGSTVNQGAGKINYGGTMAVYFTVTNATYNLDGKEVKIETKQGLVRVRAKADKSGRQLQFTTIRQMKTPNGEMEVTTRETWKLAEDGKSMRLHRTVETPTTRDEIVMTMAKVEV